MSEDLKDILSHLNPDVDQETLLLYLQGKLSAEQQHEVEKRMLEDDFNSEAMEGLQEITDQKKIAILMEQLNRDLKKKTESKKRRRKPDLRLDPTLIIAIILILLVVVVAYVVIHRKMTGQP